MDDITIEKYRDISRAKEWIRVDLIMMLVTRTGKED